MNAVATPKLASASDVAERLDNLLVKKFNEHAGAFRSSNFVIVRYGRLSREYALDVVTARNYLAYLAAGGIGQHNSLHFMGN